MEKTAPAGSIDQIGHLLMQLVHAFAEALDNVMIFQAKWDVCNSFWQIVVEQGRKRNFCYALPAEEGGPARLVIPTLLQMGWVESPPYFCAASETARNVAVDYVETPVGSLEPHKFHAMTEKDTAFQALPDAPAGLSRWQYIVEVYVDSFLKIAIPTNKEQLRHLTAGIMTGIHCLFPPLANPSRDSISIKKLKKGEGVWALQKDLLSFEFNGLPGTHMIWLEDAKSDKLLVTVKSWLRGSRSAGLGLPFDEFKFTISKVRHAFLAIPEEQGLLSPII